MILETIHFYVSLERLIEKTKRQYYQAIWESTGNMWYVSEKNYGPYIDYFLSIVLQAYQKLDAMIDSTNEVDKVC